MKNDGHGGNGTQQQSQSQSQHTTVVIASDKKPESQLQQEFRQRTGISCGKPAREWLECLMEHHGFTARELGASWRGGSIGWDYDSNQRRISTPMTEAALARGIVAWAGLYALAMVLAILLVPPERNVVAILGATGAVTLFGAVFWMAQQYVLWPRKVALRARGLD